MALELFPSFEIPDDLDDAVDEETVTYGKSFAFDFERGDFVVVAGRLVEVDGYRAWAQWCVKNVLTQRFAHIIYSDDYGIDIEIAREAASRAEAQTLIETEITEALDQDERTGSVYDFEFDWQGDSLSVSFVIEPTEGTPEQITVDLRGLT